MHPNLSSLLPVTDIDFGGAFGANMLLLEKGNNAEHRAGSPLTLATMADAYNIRIGGYFDAQATATAMRSSRHGAPSLSRHNKTTEERLSERPLTWPMVGPGDGGPCSAACRARDASIPRRSVAGRWKCRCVERTHCDPTDRWVAVPFPIEGGAATRAKMKSNAVSAVGIALVALRSGCDLHANALQCQPCASGVAQFFPGGFQ